MLKRPVSGHRTRRSLSGAGARRLCSYAGMGRTLTTGGNGGASESALAALCLLGMRLVDLARYR